MLWTTHRRSSLIKLVCNVLDRAWRSGGYKGRCRFSVAQDVVFRLRGSPHLSSVRRLGRRAGGGRRRRRGEGVWWRSRRGVMRWNEILVGAYGAGSGAHNNRRVAGRPIAASPLTGEGRFRLHRSRAVVIAYGAPCRSSAALFVSLAHLLGRFWKSGRGDCGKQPPLFAAGVSRMTCAPRLGYGYVCSQRNKFET